MAAYAALLSLAQTTDLNGTQDGSLFSSNAEEKVRSINDYVNFLLLFFEEFPEKVNRWEGRIRDVAHETEDIIEVFMGQRIQARRNIRLEDQLENVMEKIGLIAGEVMEERPAYLPPSSSSSRISSTGDDAVVGLDDDIMAMKERLCGHSSNLQVIPIVGMGGIGKSTLATTLYEDPLIIETFHIRAFVVASQDYNPLRFRRLLLGSIKGPEEQMLDSTKMSEDETDQTLKIYQNLKGRKYLVVIDDVWGTQFWDDVRFMFPDDNNGSRIILTTRLLDVAVYPYSAGHVHEMRFMNDSQSWDLLKLKVFGNGNCPSQLEEVGKETARKCAGLPLAVVLVAGVLSPVSKTRASWDEIAENVNPAVGWEIEEILSLSYNYLPHHVRPCFLYIGGFLEDVNIVASRLVRLWVAEGFVKHDSRCSKSLEEVAEEYLEDLVKRNLVMVTSKKTNGKIKSCSLHDMVRGLCIRKAHEEKFLSVLDGHDLPQGLMNERRISFGHSDINRIRCPTFRTILCFQTHNLPTSLGSYKLLRVLDALGVDLKEFPFEVFELYRLRYLALMGSLIIPSAISNLVNLETLIIHLASGKLRNVAMFHSLPLDIWRMPQLRHLFFHGLYEIPHPSEVFNYVPLENLQTLLHVKDLVWNEKIPQLIPNLKRLGLHYSVIYHCNLHYLKDMHQLEKLKVTGLLDWQHASFPCTLKKLTLVRGRFPWKDMAVVGSLPNLEVLKLLRNACIGKTWETTDEEFPRLKVLLIDESDLIEWVTHGSPFPTIKHLVLRSCRYLREMPEAIGEISTLELIEVDYCQQSLAESAQKIKEYQESWGNDALHVRIGEISTLELIEVDYCQQSHGESLGESAQKIKEYQESWGNDALHVRIGEISTLELIEVDYCQQSHGESLGESAQKIKEYQESWGNDALHVRIGHKEIKSVHEQMDPSQSIPEASRFDEDLIEIKEQLIGNSSKLQVVTIVGTRGIGKTTLATTVCYDPLITEHFEVRVWLTVSPIYSPPGHGRSRLGLAYSMKFLEEEVSLEKIDESEMATAVYLNLSCRRYLVVIDGAWSTSLWDDIRHVYPDDSNGSRIMLTTRLLHMHGDVNSSTPPHLMGFMYDHESWILLKKKVFGNRSFPLDLEDVGKEIARRCAGLPLSVVLIAGILSAADETRAAWDEIARNIKSDASPKLLDIIRLSYSQLSPRLRSCFLHMGVFPKYKSIHASTLVKSWVAEGVLKHETGCSKSLEEEAEEYLEDLVKRNLLNVTSRTSDGKIERCGLNDLIRDFCISKSAEAFWVEGYAERATMPPVSLASPFKTL